MLVFLATLIACKDPNPPAEALHATVAVEVDPSKLAAFKPLP